MSAEETVAWERMWGRLWGPDTTYVDCTPKQYREFVLAKGDSIMFQGRLRQLAYRKIAPGLIRVTKAQEAKCCLCGHKL